MEEREQAQQLHRCVRSGDLASLQRLADQGVNFDVRDSNFATPLMLAAHLGKHEVVADLLRLGADPELQDEVGNTALLRAVKFGRDAAAALLIERLRDVNQR